VGRDDFTGNTIQVKRKTSGIENTGIKYKRFISNFFASHRNLLNLLIFRTTDLPVTKCEAGYYSSVNDNSCKQCPTGTISAAGSNSCTICPAGQFEFRHLVCRDCRAGKYSEAKADKCIPCGVGKVSSAKAPACTDCKAGEYASHVDNKCKICPKNTFSAGLADSCTPCAAGSYSTPGGSQCHACVPGQYVDPVLKCVDCSPSYYSTNPNMVCKKCPPGRYSDGKAKSCRQCANGLIVNPAQTGCGKPTQMPISSPPTEPCKPGTELDYTGNGYVCKDCMPGYAPYTSAHPCWKCRAGTYAPKAGSASCTICPAPKVVKGLTSCEYCPPSFHYVGYPNQQNYPFEKEAECLKCEAGTYSGFEDSGCHKCAEGYVVNANQTGCDRIVKPHCKPGTELDYTGNGYVCKDCMPGYAPYYSVHPCWKCRAGTYAPKAGSASCTICPAPKVVKGLTSCEYCPPSFHYVGYPNQQNYPFEKEAECLKCEAGTYSGFEDSGCHKCPADKVVNANQTGCI
jgi:Tyrosine-protein kinase ephrin type A/B receptor-like